MFGYIFTDVIFFSPQIHRPKTLKSHKSQPLHAFGPLTQSGFHSYPSSGGLDVGQICSKEKMEEVTIIM